MAMGQPVFRMAPVPYGFGTDDWSYMQYLQGEQQQREAEQRYQASLAAQLAGQQYQNASMGIRNANDAAQAQVQLANMGLNFQNDAVNRALQVGRMGTDIIQTQSQQRDAARRAQLDVAQLQQNYRMQALNKQEDIQRELYNRSNSEVRTPFTIAKNAYGFR